MNYPLIRRAAALALALIFALTLPLSLAAPAWAADTDGLTITAKDAGEDGKLTLKPGGTAELEAVWDEGKGPQEGATEITYSWTCDPEDAVTFAPDDAAAATVKAGETTVENATITVTVTWKTAAPDSTEQKGTATYALTIKEEDDSGLGDIGISFSESGSVLHDPTRWSLEAVLTGVADPDNAEIIWTVARQLDEPDTTKLPDLEGTIKQADGTLEKAKIETATDSAGKIISKSITTTGRKITVVDQGAGKFVIKAQYKKNGETYTSPSKYVTVSGIVLAWPSDEETVMMVGQSGMIAWTAYGDAASLGAPKVVWTSSNASVVFVMANGGNLTAREPGRAEITATMGKYSAVCKVRVVEDSSVIADRYPNNEYGKRFTATASQPLTLDIVYPRLEEICEEKTRPAGGEKGDGSELSYITNLWVSPDQGTLYYNYSTEADTGFGVGSNDQFADPAKVKGAIRRVDKLYFVPKQGFSDTAEITFNGIAESGQNFAGIIRVEVSSGSGAYKISYRAQAGEPVWFQTSDFDAYCQNENGRTYNYIIFNLPKASEGVLYYNYVAESGNPVTTTTRFTPSGRYTLNDVCFVPNAAYQGKSVIITFRGEDTSGEAISGVVEVNVTQSSTEGDPANVAVSGERGRPVTLQSSLFNFACRATLGDTLNFVTFKLPDPDEGTLYINYRSDGDYDSRVAAGTRCYFSGVPGLDSVSFVPASNAVGQVAISYTGYGAGGASFSGVLYITLEDANRSTIRYSVAKGGTVTFSASDFYNAGLYQKGVGVTSVVFDAYSTDLGKLYHNYRGSNYYNWEVASGTYYYTSTSYSNRLGLISFHAGNKAGVFTISYTAYCGTGSSQQWFTGKVVIQVGAPTPANVVLSCKTGEQARLTVPAVSAVCGAVMSESLSYIEITSVPDAKVGHLYYDYNGFGTGTAVEQGDLFYCIGSPSIGRLIFVPFARFTGEAEITYIGYSGDGREQVSGRIVVKVSKPTDSWYFTDMSGSKWAIGSVDYLYRNDTVKGVGSNRFDPDGPVTKGDFALMLVRAYGLTASGSVSFKDVPADIYYADAVRITAVLGIISGSDGYYNPTAVLTRQEAILMIYNTLKASGKAATNGLAADLSAYHDGNAIDAGAREAMGILVQMGVVEGDGGYLRPQRQLARSEAAMLLHTIMTL